MDIDGKIQYWINLAIDNLDTAKILFIKKKILDSGYYCHQVIEKALKGYFWFNKKEDHPFTHNLIKLAEKSNLYSLMSEEQKKFIDYLMPLNIEGRYPDEKEAILKTINKKEFKKIIKQTEDMLKWIMQLLKK